MESSDGLTRSAGTERGSGLRSGDSPSPSVASGDLPGYLAYYGLRDPPFRGGIDPRLLWLGKTRREALAALIASVHRGGGILVLTGDAGAGKTSLINRLVELLGADSLVVGRINGPAFDISDLHEAIADAFGIAETAHGRAVDARLRELLDGAARMRKRVILIVDEAQSLSDELLGEVGDLSTIESSDGRHHLAVLLVGQDDLAATLSKDQHAALSQRISARCVLEPLAPEDVGEYIRSCLRTVGFEGEMFDADAVRQIAAISRGAPGVINVVCDRVLRTGHARQSPVIGPEIIDACFGERPSGGPSPPAGEENPGRVRGEDAWPGRASMGGPVSESRLPVRQKRVSSASALWIGVLAAAVLGTSGYGLHAGWFRSVRGDSLRQPATDARGATPHRQSTESARPAIEDQAGRRDAGAAIAPPSVEELRRRLAEHDRREGKEPGAPELSRPAPIKAARPADVVSSRERPKPRAPELEKEGDDPGAIIDWLMKESGKR